MVGRRTAVNSRNNNNMQCKSVACIGGFAACHAAADFYSRKSLVFPSIGFCNARWHDIMVALWNLLFPRGCAGCDFPDAVLCEKCCGLLQCWQCAPFRRAVFGCRYSCGIYSGAVRRAILMWKDHCDVACDEIFSILLSNLVVQVMGELLKPDFYAAYANPILVIPMPSSNSSTRRRGRKHMLPIARMITECLCNSGFSALTANIVNMDSGVKTKSVQTSGSRGRSSRAAHAFKINRKLLRKCKLNHNQPCFAILVDDIVTTGSTMSSCVVALQNINVDVLACFSLACVRNVGDGTVDYAGSKY